MAFDPRRIYPNDLRPRVAIGVDLPLDGPIAFIPNYQTKDAVKNNLINYLLTNPGERLENPTFGAGLREYIFNAINTENFDFIKENLQDKIDQNFDNIEILSINVGRNVNENTINVSINYKIPNTGINDELELNFG